MSAQVIHLKSDGGVPEVEVVFGQAQLGNYACSRWRTPSSTTAETIAQGNNVDDRPDRFSLGDPPPALKDNVLGFSILIQAASPGPGQLFSYAILIRQDGAVVPGGSIRRSGPLGDSALAFLEYVRFA